jgi:hypothetical protein
MMSGRRRTTTAVALAIATGLMALAITASPAAAASTRAEYVAQVDPICQAAQAQEAAALQPFLRAAKRAQKHHKLRNPKVEKRLARRFVRFFSQYAAIERQVNAQIATIQPAPEDVSLVQVWLRARGELIELESRLFTTKPNVGRGLKGFARFFNDFLTLAARQLEVVDLVRDFGFQYCDAEQQPVFVVGNTIR